MDRPTMERPIFEIRYRSYVSNELAMHIPERFVDACDQEGGFEYSLLLSNDELVIQQISPMKQEVGFDLQTGKRWIVDHDRKAYSPMDEPPLHPPDPRVTDNIPIRLDDAGERRFIRIGKHPFRVNRQELTIGQLHMELWLFEANVAPQSPTNRYWRTFLPEFPGMNLPTGLPAEIIVHSTQDPTTLALHTIAVNVDQTMKPQIAAEPPKDYKVFSAMAYSSDNPRSEAKAMSTEAASSLRPAPILTEEAQALLENLGTGRLFFAAPSEQQSHFAWMICEPFLEQIRELINGISKHWGTWRNHAGQSSFPIDWWGHQGQGVRHALGFIDNPETPENEMAYFQQVIQTLLLAIKIITDGDKSDADIRSDEFWVANLSEELLNDYIRLHHEIRSGLSIESPIVELPSETRAIISRYVLAVTSASNFTGSNRERFPLAGIIQDTLGLDTSEGGLFSEGMTAILEDQILEEFTKPITIDLDLPGEKEFTIFRKTIGKWGLEVEVDITAGVVISDLEIELSVGAQDIINSLSFHQQGNRLRAILTFERLHVDFNWYTYPKVSIDDILAAIAFAGINIPAEAATANGGRGFVSFDNPTLVFDLVPYYDETQNRSGLQVVFQKYLSTVDSSFNFLTLLSGAVLFFGPELVGTATAAATVGQAIASLCDAVNESLFSNLAKAINSELEEPALFWPESLWNATSGPPSRSTWIRNLSLWTGGLAEVLNQDGPSINISNVNEEYVDSMGYLFTEEYLTGWLRSMIGTTAENRDLSGEAEWEKEFDIDLPSRDQLAVLPVVYDELARNRRVQIDTEAHTARLRAFQEAVNVGNFSFQQPRGCDRPAAPPADLWVRTRVTRSQPTVVFEEAGTVKDAGTVRINYEFAVEAVRINYFYALAGVTGGACVDASLPTGLGGFGLAGSAISRQLSQLLGRQITMQDLVNILGSSGSLFQSGSSPASLFTISSSTEGYTPPDSDLFPDTQPDGLQGQPPRDLAEMLQNGSVICSPPECHWTLESEELVLRQYVTASVEIEGCLQLGFDHYGAPLLPAIAISIDKGDSDDYALTAIISNITVVPPFNEINLSDLKSYIIELCLNDLNGKEQVFLFGVAWESLTESEREALGRGVLPQILRQAFENHGISLSPDDSITLTTEVADSKWRIDDDIQDEQYIASKQDEVLNIRETFPGFEGYLGRLENRPLDIERRITPYPSMIDGVIFAPSSVPPVLSDTPDAQELMDRDQRIRNCIARYLLNIIDYRQSGPGNTLEYKVENGILYWPFDMNIGNLISLFDSTPNNRRALPWCVEGFMPG